MLWHLPVQLDDFSESTAHFHKDYGKHHGCYISMTLVNGCDEAYHPITKPVPCVNRLRKMDWIWAGKPLYGEKSMYFIFFGGKMYINCLCFIQFNFLCSNHICYRYKILVFQNAYTLTLHYGSIFQNSTHKPTKQKQHTTTHILQNQILIWNLIFA